MGCLGAKALGHGSQAAPVSGQTLTGVGQPVGAVMQIPSTPFAAVLIHYMREAGFEPANP